MVITMKKENILISLLLLCPILVLIGVFIWGIQEKRTPREVFLKNQIKKEFNAKVSLIKNDKDNHYSRTMYSKDSKIVLPKIWDNMIQVGDSISKHSGNLYLKIYRNGEMIDSLNYNDLSGW